MLLTVLACINEGWFQDSSVEITNPDNLLVEAIKDLERLKNDKCNKYIIHDYIGERFIIVDFEEKKSNFKIITKNELEGLAFFIK